MYKFLHTHEHDSLEFWLEIQFALNDMIERLEYFDRFNSLSPVEESILHPLKSLDLIVRTSYTTAQMVERVQAKGLETSLRPLLTLKWGDDTAPIYTWLKIIVGQEQILYNHIHI